MDKSNNFFYLSFLIILIITGCVFEDSQSKINAFTIEGIDSWNSSKLSDAAAFKEIDFVFLNNPYNFNSEDKMIVSFMDEIVYKGSFANSTKFNIGNYEFVKINAGVKIYSNNKTYHFIQKKSSPYNMSDKYVYMVFCPSNELVDGAYLFFQEERLF